MSLDLGVEYNFMNPVGREFVDVDPRDDRRLDSYLALNDDKDPLFFPNDNTHFLDNSRSIQSVLLTASLMFGL
jgi:hypothetical protein